MSTFGHSTVFPWRLRFSQRLLFVWLICRTENIKSRLRFHLLRLFYPTDYGRTAFIRVTTNSDQTIINVGVSFCAEFCEDK